MTLPTAIDWYMNVIVNDARAEIINAPPLAWNPLLTDAARGHTAWMFENDEFSHRGPTPETSFRDRIGEAGYTNFFYASENLVGGSATPEQGQKAMDLALDAFLNSPPHRGTLIIKVFEEVGYGIEFRLGTNPFGREVYKFNVTQDFATKNDSGVFLTGTAFQDIVNPNGSYDIGEGIGGGVVTATNKDGMQFSTNVFDVGGYVLEVPTGSGPYTVTFSYNGFFETKTVDVDNQNVRADFIFGDEPNPAENPNDNTNPDEHPFFLNPLFSDKFYFEENPDVAEAGADAWEHFLAHGIREGRDPNPFFDTSFYLENNPDVAEAEVNPLDHYLFFGGFEGRDPGPNFDSSFYLETYRDVASAEINPLLHFLNNGRSEGRLPEPLNDAFEFEDALHNEDDLPLVGMAVIPEFLLIGV